MRALFLSIWPGLLTGLVLSSLLVAWRPVHFLKYWAVGNGLAAIVLMSLVGVLSPFCSFLAIPFAPAPVFAFMCATPLMNPNLFFMTLGVFGWPMSLARAGAALMFGVLGGLAAIRFGPRIVRGLKRGSAGLSGMTEGADESGVFARRWLNSFFHMGWFVLKFVLLGIFAAALVKELVPAGWVTAALGQQQRYGVVIGAMLGVPLYACGGGTIPFIEVLTNMGMSPGSALAFFLAGPATKVQTVLVMQSVMGLRVASAYIAGSILWSIAAGFVYQWLIA